MSAWFTSPGLARLRQSMTRHIDSGRVPGLAWLVSRGDEVHAGTAGVADLHTGRPLERDAIFRVASLTKPVTAAATLCLIGAGRLRLDEPVDRWLPELAHRRVLRRPDGPLDDTVPAERQITVQDLLAFTCGYGYDFAAVRPQTQIAEMARLGLGVGPPAPATMPRPDEWLRRLGTIPLDHQPGAAWRYHTASEILGVLLSRVTGQPLGDVLAERVLGPLGMVDTAFSVDATSVGRLTTSYELDPVTRRVYDPPDGQWATPPVFPSGGGGLLSTVDDFLAFGRALLDSRRGTGLLSAAAVAAMTSDHLDPAGPGITGDGTVGWGFGVDVQRRPGEGPRSPGSYGWVGGLGTAWMNDPAAELVGVLFTNQAMTSPDPSAVMGDFWSAVYAALA